MKRRLLMISGCALLLLSEAGALRDVYFQDVLLREDLRAVGSALVDALAATRWATVFAGAILLGTAVLGRRLVIGWAAGYWAMAFWSLSAPDSAPGQVALWFAGAWLLVMLVSRLGRLPWLPGSKGPAALPLCLLGLIGFEASQERIHEPWLSGYIFSNSGPDALWGLLCWGGLALAAVLAMIPPRPSWRAAVGLSLAVLSFSSLPSWELPAAEGVPAQRVWVAPGPVESGLDIVYPWRTPDPVEGLGAVQRRAIRLGDTELQARVWKAVLNNNPLSLRVSSAELDSQIRSRPEQSEQLRRYLPRGFEAPKRVVLSGQLRNGYHFLKQTSLRLVASDSHALAVRPELNKDEHAKAYWKALQLPPPGLFRLYSSQAAQVVITDEQGRYEFSPVVPGYYGMLLAKRPWESSFGGDSWRVRQLTKALSEEILLGYDPPEPQPMNLDFSQPPGDEWRARSDGREGPTYRYNSEAGQLTVLGELESYSGLRQDIEARKFRGKRLRLTVTVTDGGKLKTEFKSSFWISLRTGGSEYESQKSDLRGPWPERIVVEYLVPDDANELEMAVFSSGRTHFTVSSFELEVLDR